MIHILTPKATPTGQETEVSADHEQLGQVVRAAPANEAGTEVGKRDACMFLLMFAGLLRRSELVRMNKGDVRVEEQGAAGGAR